jgi:SNF2 family DNA or RNA helicase
MGLGKTVQTMALIHQNRLPISDRGCNLIVAPVALIRQWEKEILTKTRMDQEYRLRVIVWCYPNLGSSRKNKG